MTDAPLAGLTVVESAGSIAGAYCARLFALQGADVRVVGHDGLDQASQLYLRQDIDVSAEADIEWNQVDVLIESGAPRPPEFLDVGGADLVRVRLSPFTEDGPYATWASTDAIDYAASGHANLYGAPGEAPLTGPANQPAIATGLFGFIGAMAALLRRQVSGYGETVRASHHETMVALHQMTMLRYTMTGYVLNRMGNRYAGQGQPNGLYPCGNGWVSICAVTQPQADAVLAVTGLGDLLDHPDIETSLDLQQHPELLDVPLTAWLAERDVDEVVELFQALRVPACPASSPRDLLNDPHLRARNFWRIAGDQAETAVPGAPFTRTHHQTPSGTAWHPSDSAGGPLAGLKVLDLTRVWAGPLCTRILADLGAEVVMVEAPFARGPVQVPQQFIDVMGYFPNDEGGDEPWNRNGHILKFALGKSSLAIDLQTDAGRVAFEQVVSDAHVLVENFTPRVMPQLGLSEDRLHELNPDLIYVTMPGYGRSGPCENWLAYGSCIDSHAGLSHLIGYDEPPYKGGVAWPDPIAGLHSCSALLASLWGSAVGGHGGCTIEAAQFEAMLAAVGDHIVAAQLEAGDRGLAEWTVRCAGDDRWIAVAAPDAAADAALRQFGGAAADADLGDVVAQLARSADAFELATALQSAGVPAAPVTVSYTHLTLPTTPYV